MKMNKEIKNTVEKNPIALATTQKNKPNVIAVAFCKVVNNKIVVTDNFMRVTKANIIKNRNVCLAVWNKKWKGYKIEGTAKYFAKGKWKQFVERMKENKGTPSKGAIIVTIKKISRLC